jgi:hypothetical protein
MMHFVKIAASPENLPRDRTSRAGGPCDYLR